MPMLTCECVSHRVSGVRFAMCESYNAARRCGAAARRCVSYRSSAMSYAAELGAASLLHACIAGCNTLPPFGSDFSLAAVWADSPLARLTSRPTA
ncbi:hypothetical protein EVAR_60392_1 [Eumeta japonica]|uniref:Uncharacterized protein n=1 Tax=Eumeta variegata TaxID=151549 RepID=A0A4C1YR98_EUMVA|nr:hypothetical protein EVAR_60392_1 [Eumeta japonica]